MARRFAEGLSADNSSVRRLVVFLAYAILRVSIAMMMAAGGATIVAVMSIMREPSPEWAQWATPLRHASFAIAGPFLVAALLALAALPRPRELARVAPDASQRDEAIGMLLPLSFLAIVAVWQTPMLLAWWVENERLLQQLTAGERDPMGYWIIPAVIVNMPLFIAMLITLLFVTTTIAFFAAPARVRSRLLLGCVALPCGLVVGASLAFPPIRSLAAAVFAVAASAPDKEILAAITEPAVRQDVFATTLLLRFQWILGGYILAALMSWHRQSRTQ